MVNIANKVRPNIFGMKPYSSARDEFKGDKGVFLDANENPFGELNRYPDPYQKELKQKLAILKEVDTNNIFIGNGSDEVIDLAFRIFCSPGLDKGMAFSPSYGMYDVSAAINNVELIKIPLDGKFQLDLAQLTPYLADNNLKLIFICSPNNPTGNLMRKRDIEFILKSFDGIVIIDEAYIDFAEAPSLVSLINQYNNLIVCQTFSKAFGLAGARVGAAYASEEIISVYNKVKPPYNVSQLNQQAAIDSLDNDKIFKERLAIILTERERLKTALNEIGIVKKIYPSDANFLLVEIDKSEYVYSSLVNQEIITRNRNNQVENGIRITVGSPEENNELVKALKKVS